MHVLQLLNFFLLAPQIEIVETTLPEPTGEEKFLGRFVEFGPAVRLYREGRATGPPED